MTLFTAFGMDREPFDLVPDPEMYYPAMGHEDCLERLRPTVALGLGLAFVTGAPGTGKSMIRARLLDEIAHHPGLMIGVIEDPAAARADVPFLRMMMQQIGCAPTGRTSLDLSTGLLTELTTRQAAGERVVMAIDQAHNLTSGQLDVLRTLVTAAPAPLMVLLFGEPELADKIARKRNLAQRAAMTHTLNPLNQRDTAGLLQHRLEAAGGIPSLISDEAIGVIHRQTDGVPGRIVTAAAACLDLAVAENREMVDEALARRALVNLESERGTPAAGVAPTPIRRLTTAIQTSFVVQLDEAMASPAAAERRRDDRSGTSRSRGEAPRPVRSDVESDHRSADAGSVRRAGR